MHIGEAREIAEDRGLRARNGGKRLTGALDVAGVQYDVVSTRDEQPRCHLAQAIGGAGDEDPCHGGRMVRRACAASKCHQRQDAWPGG